MRMHNLVMTALKERAPALHKSLDQKGEAGKYVEDLASQISDETVRLTQEQRQREGWDKLGPMESAARMRAADAMNLEVALADLLEFPQDETSRPSQDETTNSAPTT